MSDELEQLLKNLHLRRILTVLDDETANAEKNGLSYSELVVRLLRAQWYANQEGALAWRIKRACLPEQWTIESLRDAQD
jgi:hypothetical protein